MAWPSAVKVASEYMACATAFATTNGMSNSLVSSSRLDAAVQMNIRDVVERVRCEHDFAWEVGAPGYYDYGPQRVSWLGNVLTNWIGDDG